MRPPRRSIKIAAPSAKRAATASRRPSPECPVKRPNARPTSMRSSARTGRLSSTPRSSPTSNRPPIQRSHRASGTHSTRPPGTLTASRSARLTGAPPNAHSGGATSTNSNTIPVVSCTGPHRGRGGAETPATVYQRSAPTAPGPPEAATPTDRSSNRSSDSGGLIGWHLDIHRHGTRVAGGSARGGRGHRRLVAGRRPHSDRGRPLKEPSPPVDVAVKRWRSAGVGTMCGEAEAPSGPVGGRPTLDLHNSGVDFGRCKEAEVQDDALDATRASSGRCCARGPGGAAGRGTAPCGVAFRDGPG